MAAKSPPPPSVNEAETLMQKARSRGHGRRSPIMVWMQQNRQELEAAFARTAPAWSVLATYLGERGITDGDGKPPTARATRGAWARVKKNVSDKAQQGVKPPPTPSNHTPSRPTPLAATPAQLARPVPIFDAMEGADEAPATPIFGISTLRRD